VAESPLADGAYDSNEIIQLAEKRGMQVVIPPKKIGNLNALMVKAYIS